MTPHSPLLAPLRLGLSFTLVLALAACAGDVPGPGTGDDDSTTNPGAPDAGPVTNPGAPDAAPTPPPTANDYPPGPYGVTKGAVISNRKWMGYMDTDADADKDPFNEPAHMISLADFYRGNHPDSHLLLMIQSAGWCGPCQEEAAHLPEVSAPWLTKHIRFMTAMWQNPDGSPGSTDYAREWGTMFHQNTPVVADPDDLAGGEFGGDGIPFFILIDTKTMTIVDFPWGSDLGDVYQMYQD
jgi:hypothetical protein